MHALGSRGIAVSVLPMVRKNDELVFGSRVCSELGIDKFRLFMLGRKGLLVSVSSTAKPVDPTKTFPLWRLSDVIRFRDQLSPEELSKLQRPVVTKGARAAVSSVRKSVAHHRAWREAVPSNIH